MRKNWFAIACAAGAAAFLAADAAPAAAQTVAYQWLGLNISQFPTIRVDWAVGTASGSEQSTPVGMSIQVPRDTPVGTVARMDLSNAATSEAYCRIEVAMPAANGCEARPSSTPRCTVTRGEMGGGMCQVWVSFNP